MPTLSYESAASTNENGLRSIVTTGTFVDIDVELTSHAALFAVVPPAPAGFKRDFVHVKADDKAFTFCIIDIEAEFAPRLPLPA